MYRIITNFKESTKKMKQVRVLSLGGMLTALQVLSSTFLHFYPSETVKISFSFVFIAIAAYLCGPVISMTVAGLGDFLTWVIHPHGALNPGITLSMMIMGLLFGLFYYNEKISWKRVIAVSLAETVIVELLMKSYFLKLFYALPYFAVVVSRLLGQTIMLVVMVALTPPILKICDPIKNRLK